MSKIGLIIGREYFTRVKKKSFLITTILVPAVIIAFYAVIIAIGAKGSTEKQKIAVVDQSGLLADSKAANNKDYTIIKNESETSFVKKYQAQGYEAFLYIPKVNLDTPHGIVLHSESTVSFATTEAIRNIIDQNIEAKRLSASGIDPAKYQQIKSDVKIETTIDTKDGGKKGNIYVAYGVSYGCGILIYMMMIIYGTQVMRGVTEEKTNRIAEVVVSSVKPFELMMGKIIGIGAVGLTQFAIWILLIFGISQVFPMLAPDTTILSGIMQGLSSLPVGRIILYFLVYFVGGYLTYASLFAAVGSVVSEDQQEAQQLMFPILMPIILGFVIMSKAVNDPNSSLAVFGSLFPLTSPIVMMGRITYSIPVWQVATSMLLLVACFLLLTWLTGKIYRTGILMYGKKPSWKEMMKWAFRSNT